MESNSCLLIDTEALAGNVRAIREDLGEAELVAVVKGNAYGLGAVSERFFDRMGQSCRSNTPSSRKAEQLDVQCGTLVRCIDLIKGLSAEVPVFKYRVMIQSRSVGFDPPEPGFHFFVCLLESVRESDKPHHVPVSPEALDLFQIFDRCFFNCNHFKPS